MKINTFLTADKIYTDTSTKKLSIEGIFDIIFAKSLPAFHQELFTITIFEGPNKNYDYHLIFKKGSTIIMESKSTISKTGGKEHNIITRLNNVPLFDEGEYTFEMKLDNQIRRRTIDVKKINN